MEQKIVCRYCSVICLSIFILSLILSAWITLPPYISLASLMMSGCFMMISFMGPGSSFQIGADGFKGKISDLDPVKKPEDYYELATNLFYGKEFILAKAVCIVGLGLNPIDNLTKVKLIYRLGAVYFILGSDEEALQCFNESILLDEKSEFAWPYNGQGEVFFKLERYPEAMEKFDKAIELNIKDPIPYYNMAVTILKYEVESDLHDSDEKKDEAKIKALDHLKNAKQINPDDPITSYYMGLYYINYQDDKELAKNEFRHSLKQNLSEYKLLTKIGVFYNSWRIINDAENIFLKSLEINEQWYETHYHLGSLYVNEYKEEIESVVKAITHFKRALVLKPNHDKSKDSLKRAENILKGFKEASRKRNDDADDPLVLK